MALNYELVSFNLLPETEASIISKNTFLSEWNTIVRFLKDLTGYTPGSHANRQTPVLTFVEVNPDDAEVAEKIAVWSAVDGVIKINSSLAKEYIKAFALHPLVVEFMEAIGDAALQFQRVEPDSTKELLGFNAFIQGFKKAVGMYALKRVSTSCSSIFKNTVLTPMDALSNDLLRCYRKRRLGYMGATLTEPAYEDDLVDSDISYGMFVELFFVQGHEVKIKEFISNLVTSIKLQDNYEYRVWFKVYYDFMIGLSEAVQLNINTLLLTWGFTDLNFYTLVNKDYPDPFTNSAIEMSETLQYYVDRNIVEKELNAEYLPTIITGCSDALGLGFNGSSVVVLFGAPPANDVYFEGRAATLLGCSESNSYEFYTLLPCNLGDISENPVTVLVPIGNIAEFPYKDYVFDLPNLDNYSLIYCSIVHLGAKEKPYRSNIIQQSEDGNPIIGQIDVETETYAIIALDNSTFKYEYINDNCVYTLVIEKLPRNLYYNPIAEENVSIPGGMQKNIKVMRSTLKESGFVNRTFRDHTEILDSYGEIISKVSNGKLTDLIDSSFYFIKERPAIRGNKIVDIYSELRHQVDQCKLAAFTSLNATLLAQTGDMTMLENYRGDQNTETGELGDLMKKREEVAADEIKKEGNMQVVVERAKVETFVSALTSKDSPIVGQGRDRFIFVKLIEFYESLSIDEKLAVDSLKEEYPITIKDLDQFEMINIGTDETVGVVEALYALGKITDPRPMSSLSDDSLILIGKKMSDLVYDKKLAEQRREFKNNMK